LRTSFINRAQARDRVQSDTRAVTLLIHAPDSGVLDHELLRHVVHHWLQFNQQVTAFAATGTVGKVVEDNGHQWSIKHAENPIRREQSFPAGNEWLEFSPDRRSSQSPAQS
jgi:hypothetical protein